MKKQGGLLFQAGKIILTLSVISLGFFYFGQNCLATEHLIINEIQVYPTEKRFIELYNPNDFSVDLTSWSVKKKTSSGKEYSLLAISRFEGKSILPKGYFLLANEEGYSGGVVPNVLWAKSNTFAKNNTIILYDNNANVVDKIGFGLATDFEIERALNPDVNQSLARKLNIDTDNNFSDFEIQDFPNPQNSGGEEIESPEDNPPPPVDEPSEDDPPVENDIVDDPVPSTPPAEILNYQLGDVVINELISDPTDGEVEWIELYNKTNQEINLTDWKIIEGSETKTSLENIISGNGFLVIETPKGNLNNKGDVVYLRDNNENLIDVIAYGNWDDGQTNNNAPVASDPYSIARKFDGLNSYNNFNDFAITSTITKGTSNIIIAIDEEEEITVEDRQTYDYSDDIIISEILPNPLGSDTEAEWIELFNKGNQDVNLLGWRLGDNSQRKYEIKEGLIIKAKEYFIVERSISKIALNNSGDSVKLFQPLKDEPLRILEYEKGNENWSYSLSDNINKYVWSEIITPGEHNIIKTINYVPIVDFDCPEQALLGQEIYFDSSDTIDEDEDELIFNWDFGDGIKLFLSNPTHTYLQVGTYTVKLIVGDSQATSTKEKIINIRSDSILPNMLSDNNLGKEEKIIISEILPNPIGSDPVGEWIEINNVGSASVNLLDWQIDDEDGGSRPYKFITDLWLEPGQFYVLSRASSSIALNNTGDEVRLFNKIGELVDEMGYGATSEEESYARGANNNFFWTSVPTPKGENIISVSDSLDVNSLSTNQDNLPIVTNQVMEVSLFEIKELEPGALIKTKGTVAVLPGVLGSQYFYIVGSPGIQIYNYKKDFPNLKLGDYIEVSGELSLVNGEQRIKTKVADDMKIVENRDAPIPSQAICEQLDDNYLGQLITITGEVVDKKSSSIYVDDGTDEVLVYLKSGANINSSYIKEGALVTVTGLVSRTKSGLRILPRSNDDLIVKDIESQETGVGKVLGEISPNDEWIIAGRDKKIELFKYLLIIAGAVIIVLFGLLIKEFRKK